MKELIGSIQKILKRNSPTILSGTAITGVLTTAYLAARASGQASNKLNEYYGVDGYHHRNDPKYVFPYYKDQLINDVKLVWKLYIPATISGVFTVVCIVGTTKVTNKRAAVAQAAFVMSERAYEEYRAKVVEEYGERKDQTLRDSIASDKVLRTPPPATMIVGSGNVICCELYTMRYFESDMETLRKVVNEINAQLLRHDQATLDDFYHYVGLEGTTNSGDIGWYSDRLLELEFTSVLDSNGRPCLAFAYNYTKPLYEGLYKG